MYTYKALVKKVVDGDTFDAEVDLGFNLKLTIRFRLEDIDTPELKSIDAEERKRAIQARELLSNLILNKEVILSSKKGVIKEVVYNRWQARVFVNDVDVIEMIKQSGLIKKQS